MFFFGYGRTVYKIILSVIYHIIAIQGGVFKQIFYKISYKFLRYMRTICPKIFAKMDTLPQCLKCALYILY